MEKCLGAPRLIEDGPHALGPPSISHHSCPMALFFQVCKHMFYDVRKSFTSQKTKA